MCLVSTKYRGAKVNNVTFGWEYSQIASQHVTPDEGAVLQHTARVMSLALLVHCTDQSTNRPPWHAL